MAKHVYGVGRFNVRGQTTETFRVGTRRPCWINCARDEAFHSCHLKTEEKHEPDSVRSVFYHWVGRRRDGTMDTRVYQENQVVRFSAGPWESPSAP